MKIILNIVPVLAFGILCSFAAMDPDKDKSSQFFRQAADTAILDRAQSRLALEKATSGNVKKYAAMIIRDESAMLDDMQPAATKRGFELPNEASQENKESYQQLRMESGKDFDELYLKMMKADHAQSIRELKKGRKADEPEVRSFALKYLPVERKHLAAMKAVNHGKPFKD